MTLKEQMAADLPLFFNTDEFAESAVYKGVAIDVVEDETGERSTGSPGFVVPLFTILVKASDVSRPKAGDSVTFRGVSCKAGPFPRSQGGVWVVDLVQDTVQV
jgi:hypothetical protein